MNFIIFCSVMNITKINITLNSDNSNIAKTRTQHRQIMATITNGVFKFYPIIKISIVANHLIFTVITLVRSILSLKSILLHNII